VPTESSALLVLRVWREEESPIPLRAEIRMTRDVAAGFEKSLTVTDVDSVVRLVRDWLSEVG
jgi:hypothetical protein